MPDDVVSQFDIFVEQQDGYAFTVRFDREQFSPIHMDEPPPLGKDSAPNPARILAAAIGNCLSASLVFCMARQHKVQLRGVKTSVHVEIVRNAARRLRVGRVKVTLDPGPQGAAAADALKACGAAFEDFCTVTQSIRDGIDVDVEVVGLGPTRLLTAPGG